MAVSVEDRLKLTPRLALIGGVRARAHRRSSSNGINFDGTMPPAHPFTKTWNPVSYRAAVTYRTDPQLDVLRHDLDGLRSGGGGHLLDPAPTSSLELTSARIYEAGVKQLFWDNRAEWTFSAYDITRRNVYV